MLTLLALAIALRATGATLRSAPHPLVQAPGWILCLVATWVVAGVAGIWFPLWVAVAIGALGAIVQAVTEDPRWMVAGDLLFVGLVAVWATPPPSWGVTVSLAAGLALGWSAIEAWARLTPVPLRFATPVLGAVAVVVLGLRLYGASDPLRPLPFILPHLTVAPACEGERVDLPTGAVAWYDTPRGSGPHAGAVVFHGAEPRGSRQPAACSLRRALLRAGFATLAVDHPGYGATLPPSTNEEVEAWDPLPSQIAALEWLEGRPEVDGIHVAAGHSMGGTDVIRLLAVHPGIPLTVLFGRGLSDGAERDDYWYERFHTDRGLEGEVGMERWREIQDRYYSFSNAARSLPPDHGHVVFATFGWEWENLEATRERAYELIPGSKEVWHLPRSSHYFSAFTWHGLVAADAGVARTVASGIRRRADEL